MLLQEALIPKGLKWKNKVKEDMDTKKILLICVGILAIAAIAVYFIFMSEPTAKSEGATRKSAMLVDVVQVERGDFQPVIQSTGTVEPVEDVMLSPLVGGQVIRRSPSFVPGGFVKKGDVLLQIDPSDYRNVLELRKSELQQTETDLDVEMGRQEVAEQDLQLVGGDSLSQQERSLVLRQPQLNAVKANIKASRAAVDQAELELARTTIRAPFDAHVLSQNVTVGSQVSPGDNLGRLVGSEKYWVMLSVPVGKLSWMSFPDSEDERGSEVKIRNTTAWPPNTFRTGYLEKQVGALDERTRLARVLVSVPDPLAKDLEDKPVLMIGAFVEANLQGETVQDVVRLDRNYVRNNNQVWVMENGKLAIKDVEIVLTDSEYAYISSGLEDGDRVVTTNLSTVAEGVDLRNEASGASDSIAQPEQEE